MSCSVRRRLKRSGSPCHEGLAETVALDVRDRVRAPQRIGDEAHRLLGSLLGRQRPAHQVVAGLVERPAVRVHHPRDVSRDVEVLRRLLHRAGHVRVVRRAGSGHVLGGHRELLVAEAPSRRRARRFPPRPATAVTVQRERLLDAALLADEELFLPRVLRVMARIRLVRDDVHQERGVERRVGIDLDPAPQASEVVVVGRPGLIGHELPVDRLSAAVARSARPSGGGPPRRGSPRRGRAARRSRVSPSRQAW